VQSLQPQVHYASETKELRNLLGDAFSPDELREIRGVAEGARLQQGKIYINLRDPARRPFTATAAMTVSQHNLYVPKADTP
jgi:hypothetical protein